MKSDREKLIELIKQIGTEAKEVCNNSRCSECPGGKDCTYGLIANLIISHGVRLETKQATSEKTSDKTSDSKRSTSSSGRCSPQRMLCGLGGAAND